MKKYALSIAYVVMLALCVPGLCLYIWLLSVLPVPWEELADWMDSFGKGVLVLVLFLIPVILYWVAVCILGVANMVRSFRIYRTGDVIVCIHHMLILKYGMTIFFIINFIAAVLFYAGLTLGLLVGTRGLVIFAAPVILPFLAGGIIFTITATWLAILPGAFYGIQVIRFTLRERKTSPVAAVWHGFLQFVFLADVLDAMYLAVRKWGRGKKSSFVIGILYVAALAGIAGAVIILWT